MSARSVVVIGAGVAGLLAALRLAEAGCAVTVLEAAERVGGRVRTVHVAGCAVELGAEFVHGKPPELLAMLDELSLEKYELSGTNFIYGAAGVSAQMDAAEGGAFDLLQQIEQWSAAHADEDVSFAQWCARQGVQQEDVEGARGYVEGFNAADAQEISVQSLAVQQRAEDAIEGDVSFHVRGGYQGLAEMLQARLQRAGGRVVLGARVVQVRWSAGAVACVCADGASYAAQAAVVTLPLGVLQAGAVEFVPQPGDVLRQAARMRMGHVCRVNLVFQRRWWVGLQDGLEEMSFLLPEERLQGAHFNVFWTGYPSLDPVITAWSGGPAARVFDGLDEHARARVACGDLARIFGLSVQQVLDELVAHRMHDWSRDALAMGAYSWVPAGAVDASAKMAEPIEGTLFFAGEHTDVTGHWGTVHGALRSGVRAAQQVLAS